jgi:deazaflavin-dependent oxidoreductase (nitroreductase family)
MAKRLSGLVSRLMTWWHRRRGDRFMGMELLYLTTAGARSGTTYQTAVARFPDGENAWLVVASRGGSPRHPGWYHNITAHPDQVWAEVAGRRIRVRPERLEGASRAEAWNRIVAAQPRFGGYQRKTDRVLPVIRLTPEP